MSYLPNQSSFFRLLYGLGSAIRNPTLGRSFQFLMESDRWSRDRLAAYQLEQCKALLQFAGKHSPYYEQLFSKIGFDPNRFDSLEQLKQIPVTDKKTLIEQNSTIQSRYRFRRRLRECSTSGSTGSVLRFRRNEEWDSGIRAAQRRGYAWHGINPWDRNGYFWGYQIAGPKRRKTMLLDFLQNRFRIFSYNEREIVSFAKKLRDAKYVEGYSSMIYEVAKKVNALGLGRHLDLKMVLGTSEKIYGSYQAEVRRAFGRKMISEYGAAETGIIAFECPQGHMHLNLEGVVIEVESGEVIVTNLLSHSFPIIRYRLGDSVVLARQDFRCSCGRQHPVLLDVTGRVGRVIRGRTDNYPSLTLYYVFKNIAQDDGVELTYQARQYVPGKIELRIEQPDSGYAELIDREMRRYFGDDVAYTVSFDQILHTMEGKMTDFLTSLD